jgi:hypothetical protein
MSTFNFKILKNILELLFNNKITFSPKVQFQVKSNLKFGSIAFMKVRIVTVRDIFSKKISTQSNDHLADFLTEKIFKRNFSFEKIILKKKTTLFDFFSLPFIEEKRNWHKKIVLDLRKILGEIESQSTYR